MIEVLKLTMHGKKRFTFLVEDFSCLYEGEGTEPSCYLTLTHHLIGETPQAPIIVMESYDDVLSRIKQAKEDRQHGN